jgi:hypothetical protein
MSVSVRDYVSVDKHKNVCLGIRQIPVSAWQSLYGTQSLCTPARFEVYRYTTKDRQIKELISIEELRENNLIYFEFQKYVL